MRNVNEGGAALNRVRARFTFKHVRYSGYRVSVPGSCCCCFNEQIQRQRPMSILMFHHLCCRFSPLIPPFYCQIKMSLSVFRRPCYYCISIFILIRFASSAGLWPHLAAIITSSLTRRPEEGRLMQIHVFILTYIHMSPYLPQKLVIS